MEFFSIYFPQFYPISLNDKTWGKDFTDWHLVSVANQKNKWNRRIPKKGFYDGSDPKIYSKQISEMKENNIKGLALYHYYFDQSQELHCMEDYLYGIEDIEYFLIWANENWSKRWHGSREEIISLSRNPDEEFIKRHVDYLSKHLLKPNYKKIDGKPIFGFYKIDHFSDPNSVIKKYREYFLGKGIEMHFFCMISNIGELSLLNYVDSAYLFDPIYFFNTKRNFRSKGSKNLEKFIKNTFGLKLLSSVKLIMDKLQKKGITHSYSDYLKHMRYVNQQTKPKLNKELSWVINPGWNNYPRYSERNTELELPTDDQWRQAIRESLQFASKKPNLINAWNEWSEGAAIEPCYYEGNRFLDILKIEVERQDS